MGLKDSLREALPAQYEFIANLRGNGYYNGGAGAFGAIFIHIPKTAGMSMSTVLGDSRWMPHRRAVQYRQANPRKFRNFYKFSFVRNPWDRAVSSYNFLSRGGTAATRGWEHEILRQRSATVGDLSFEAFIVERLAECTEELHFRPQHSFVCENGVNLMDFTGRYENLAEDFARVAGVLGIETPLPRVNASAKRDWRQYYSPELINIVGDIYAEDIELFGYQA